MKKTLLFFLIIMSGFLAAGQVMPDNDRPAEESRGFGSQRERFYVGGDFNLYFASWGSLVNISPLGGYKLTKGLMAGIGLTYQYTSSFDFLGQRYSNNMVGGRAFLRQDLFNFMFINAEYETYYTRVFDWISQEEKNRAIPVANVGLGFKRLFSERSYYQILVQWDLIEDRFTSIYVYPWSPLSIKLGVVFCIDDF
ncbi:MAG: hypothetical protein ACHQF2_07340 [Flavobacteriales bacterium]